MNRKLAAIMVSDFVGSTSAMEMDEESAIVQIAQCLDGVEAVIGEHGGRVFNHVGDAVLAEFPSPVNAVKSALACRGVLSTINGVTAANMRFGLHLADVVEVGDDLRGDGINLAARIQSAAEPGAIEVSEVLVRQIARNSPCRFDDLGESAFKGISEPVRVFRVREQTDRHRFQVSPTRSQHKPLDIKPNSLAILPFKTASSADEDQAFLAEGLTDDLTLELSRLKNLFVSSRSATNTLESTDPVLIGSTLGVKYVLSGSVRKMGSRVRLNIALANTEDGEIIWSERIQRNFEDMFDILDEISLRVASTVSGRIEQASLAAARLKRPESMSAYECYLRGIEQHRMGGVTDEHIHRALDWFRRSIDEDPNYGRPYAMYVCSDSGLDSFDISKAERYLKQALQLDPTDPEAHRIMGVFQIKTFGDYEASRRHHETALKLAPCDAYVIGRCAAFYNFVGEAEKAMELLDRAEDLDPFLHLWVVEERVAVLHNLKRYDEMLAVSDALSFQTRRTRCYRASALMELGAAEKARQQISQALAENPEYSTRYVIAQELYQDKDVLRRLIKNAHAAGLPLHQPGDVQ